MTTPFNKVRGNGPVGNRKIRSRILLEPLLENDESYQKVPSRRGDVYCQDIDITFVTPSMYIDEVPTLVNLQAVYHSSVISSFSIDGISIDQLPTLSVPIVLPEGNLVKTEQQTAAQGYKAQIRHLIKNSGIYVFASLASPLVSLVLAPFLTRNLSHEEYGILAVMTTIISLLAGITQLGLASAFFRSYNYDYESPSDRQKVLSTLVTLLASISTLVSIIILIAAPLVATLLFKSSAFSDLIRVGVIVVLLQNFTVPGFAWLRAESRAGFFAILSVLNLLVNMSTTILFVGPLRMGVAGSLWGTGCGYAVVIVCTLPLIMLRVGVGLRFDIAKGMLSFGMPNVTTIISIWVLQLSDRYLLSSLGSLSQTASYAVAYSLGSVLSVVVLSPFTLAWPSAMFTIAKRKDATQVFQLVFRWYCVILFFMAFSLSIASTMLLNLLFPPAYHSATPIIPIIALSTLFNGVYNVLTTGISIKRKTWFAFAFMATAALVNVGLNLILIPLYGSIGAALATLLAYIVLVIIAYIVNQRLYPIPFEIGMFVWALIIGIGLYAGSASLGRGLSIYLACGVSLIALVLYGGYLVLIGWFHTRKSKIISRQFQEALLA